MARLRGPRSRHLHRIAVIEDDADHRASLVALFEREGHQVGTAADTAGAVSLVRDFRPHLILLDYYLEHGTGADVVRQIREFDALAQVLLVTGYATERPARTLLEELDIQGYHDKGDGPARLMVLADSALKHARVLSRLANQRAYLRHIVDTSAELMQLQAPDLLLRKALHEAVGLLRAAGGLVATVNSGLFVLGTCETYEVAVRAGEGRYAEISHLGQLPESIVGLIRDGLEAEGPSAHDGVVTIPLLTRAGERGCLLIEANDLPDEAIEPCQIYARQVVQALENVLLYERATVDPLTRVSNRSHGRQRIEESLRLGYRTRTPTALLVLDIDHFKALNDTYGHAAGDVMLRRVAGEISARLRSTDIVARWGGEEFVIALPATGSDGAQVVAEKLRQAVAAITVPFEGRPLSATISGGIAIAEPGDLDVDALVARADRSLYQAKRAGRDRFVASGETDDARVAV